MKKWIWGLLILLVVSALVFLGWWWINNRDFILVKSGVKIEGVNFNGGEIKKLVDDYIVDDSGQIVDVNSPIGALIKPKQIIVELMPIDDTKQYVKSYKGNEGLLAGWRASAEGQKYWIEIGYNPQIMNQWSLEERQSFTSRFIYEVGLTWKTITTKADGLTQEDMVEIRAQSANKEGWIYEVVD